MCFPLVLPLPIAPGRIAAGIPHTPPVFVQSFLQYIFMRLRLDFSEIFHMIFLTNKPIWVVCFFLVGREGVSTLLFKHRARGKNFYYILIA